VDQHTVEGAGTRAAIGRAVGSGARQCLMALILVLGVVAAIAVSVTDADRTFADVSVAVQTLMSVLVPLIGVLLVGDLRRGPRPTRVAPTLLAGVVVAVAIGVFGTLVGLVTLLVAQGTAAEPWANAGSVALGGVLVQIAAQLVGTGFGLLLRPAVVAFLATIVVPLGLWLLLGPVNAARAWLTPFGPAQSLLSGQTSALVLAQWALVAALWGGGLNALGAARLNRTG
jgi:hypothetical protein